jgi:hypothetical protein
MNAYDYSHDEDVENNLEEDRVPDILNPYIDSPQPEPVITETPVLHTPVQAPKMRSRATHFKKKTCLRVQTFASQNSAIQLAH